MSCQMRRRTGERTRRQWLFLQLSHLQLGQWLLVEQWGSHTHWSVSLVVWDFWMKWVQSQVRESYSTTISPNNTILTWISSLTMQISNIEPSTTMQCHYIVTALVHDLPQISYYEPAFHWNPNVVKGDTLGCWTTVCSHWIHHRSGAEANVTQECTYYT